MINTNYNNNTSSIDWIGTYTGGVRPTPVYDFLSTDLIDNKGNPLSAIDYQSRANTMTTGDLIGLLANQVTLTQQQLVSSQVSALNNKNNAVQVRYKELASKLQSAYEAQVKAEETAGIMKIVKWVLFALSIVVMVVAGIASGGSALPGLIVSLPFLLLTVLPGNSKDTNISAMDAWTKAMGDQIYRDCIVKPYRDALEAQGIATQNMKDDEIVQYAYDHHIQADGVVAGSLEHQKEFCQYLSMCIIIVMEIALTVTVSGIFAGSGDKKDAAANAVAGGLQAGESTVAGATSTVASTATSQAIATAEVATQTVATETAATVASVATEAASTSVAEASSEASTAVTEAVQMAAAAAKKGAQAAIASTEIVEEGVKATATVAKAAAKETTTAVKESAKKAAAKATEETTNKVTEETMSNAKRVLAALRRGYNRIGMTGKAEIAAKKIQPFVRLSEALVRMSEGAIEVKGGHDNYLAAKAHVDVDQMNAAISYLEKMIDTDQDRLRDLMNAWNAPIRQVNEIIREQHAMQKSVVSDAMIA